jgi:hypothetical protein
VEKLHDLSFWVAGIPSGKVSCALALYFVGFESNKYEVASALAKQFPALALRLPPRRKIWKSEDNRMGIFDSAAVGVAYFTWRTGSADHFKRGSYIFTIAEVAWCEIHFFRNPSTQVLDSFSEGGSGGRGFFFGLPKCLK